MSDAQRVIDEIGALVDEQMVQEASGYDWNLNQPRCRCGVRPGRKVTTDLLESSETAGAETPCGL